MLILLENDNTGAVFYLNNQKEFIVGRKDCKILIENDPSISRKHAKIVVKDDSVILEDLGSKYKTTHRGISLTPNTKVELKNNDKVHFGVMSSQFTFKQYDLVTTGTRLNSTEKGKLKQDLAQIGARYIDQWTAECTHLTVEEITLTVKVLQALIYEKPIVLPSYWTKVAECVLNNSPLPNIENFKNPPMAEALLNKVEIKADLKRKGLFQGKMFIFSKEANKQQMEDVIKRLGGNVISWEKDPLPIEDIAKSPKEFLVIQTPNESEDPSLNKIIKLLTKKGKRTIPLQEIAMAVVHGSCEKDCNPDFNRAAEVFQTTRPREPTQNNALVPNTESEQFSLEVGGRCVDVKHVIPDTFENNWDVPPVKINRKNSKDTILLKTQDETIENGNKKNSLKRYGNQQVNDNPFKKMKMEKEKIVSMSGQETWSKKKNEDSVMKPSISGKRKADEDLNATEAKKDSNPFTAIVKKSRKEPVPRKEVTSKKINPFSLITKSKENVTQISDTNPFKLPTRKIVDESQHRDTSMFSNVRVEDRSPEKTFSYSKSDSSNQNTTWFSKKSSFSIKTEEENHHDSEMQSFIDCFKNKVVVEVMASISIRPRITRDGVDDVLSRGVNNFKKFKKIPPLHPQHRIIGKENFVAVTPGDTTGINDTRRALQHDSDDESGQNQSKKRPPKKFFI